MTPNEPDQEKHDARTSPELEKGDSFEIIGSPVTEERELASEIEIIEEIPGGTIIEETSYRIITE